MTPIVLLTLAFAGGALPGLRWPVAALAATLLAASLLPLAALRRGASARGSGLLAFCLIGYATATAAVLQERADCRAQLPDGILLRAQAAVDGRLVPHGELVLRLEQISIGRRTLACSGPVNTRLSADRLAPGSAHVQVTGRWWRNPPMSGWPVRAARAGQLAVTSAAPLRLPHAHALLRARNQTLRAVHTLFPTEAALVEALLLARRESLDTALKQEFAAAGLAHLLAISGAHVGILAGIVLLLARLLRLRPRRAMLASALVTSMYVGFLGAPAAATRAAIQGLALLASRFTQRPAEPFSLLAGAALLLLAADPFFLLDAGFQLSFAGVFGLLAFHSPARDMLPRALPRVITQALAASLAASAATAPIAAWHFGLLSIIGPLANLVAAPLLALAIPAMTLSLMAGTVEAHTGRFLGGGAEIALRLLRAIAHLAAEVPAGHVRVTPDAVTATLLATAAFLIAGPQVRKHLQPAAGRRRRGRRVQKAVQSGVAIAALIAVPLFHAGSGDLEIHAINVGQGDAIAIRTPGNHWLLVDTGPSTPDFDAGRERVLPYLRAHGVRRLDVVILTHPHADHIGGAPAVWQSLPVGVVIDPATPASESRYLEVLADAASHHIRWQAGRAGRGLEIDNVTLRLLAPRDSALDEVEDPNDLSVVFHLEYGHFSALFLGDASQSVENWMIRQSDVSLASALLKVGHHGSRTATGDSLLDAVRPRVAVISVGRRNRYGHPAPDVIARLRAHGVRVMRTDLNGSVVVKARTDGTMEVFASR